MSDEMDLEMELNAYKAKVDPLIREFFVSFDGAELAVGLEQLNAPAYHGEFVRRLINFSLDGNEQRREAVSTFLSDAHPWPLTMANVALGFESLLAVTDELVLDTPQAREYLSAYIARAVADEILPPAFLSDPTLSQLNSQVVQGAIALLTRDHAVARLEHVWGPGAGRPIEELKSLVDQALEEVLLNNDINEGMRCLVELRTPYFFHEVVKRGICLVLDRTPEDAMTMLSLFHALQASDILSKSQTIRGFNRVAEIMDDLRLDVPSAPSSFQQILTLAITNGLLPEGFKPNF